jgi:hypothetical protein
MYIFYDPEEKDGGETKVAISQNNYFIYVRK